MPASLAEFTAPDRLQVLLNGLHIDSGSDSDRIENFTLLNTSKWILAGEFPTGRVRFFGFPSEKPHYVFIFDESEVSVPHIYVRTPPSGHHEELLAEGLRALLATVDPLIVKHGEWLLEADRFVRNVFLRILSSSSPLPYEKTFASECHVFYMNEQQRTAIGEAELNPPEGYSISEMNPLNDYEFVHSHWTYGHLSSNLTMKIRLESLPSSCIRDSDGNLAAWELIYQFGGLNHLYCVEAHRGRGLGVLAENLLSRTLVKQGLRVMKYVVNPEVVRGSRRSPLWSEWKPRWGGEKGEGKEDEIPWCYTNFKCINPEEQA